MSTSVSLLGTGAPSVGWQLRAEHKSAVRGSRGSRDRFAPKESPVSLTAPTGAPGDPARDQALRMPRPRPLRHHISSDPRPPGPRVSSHPPPHNSSDPGRRAHVAWDPGPATLTAFFMVAAILDWTTGRRGRPSGRASHPRGPARALLTQAPLKHSTVSTPLPTTSLTYESQGQGLRKELSPGNTWYIPIKGTGSFPLSLVRPVAGPDIPATGCRGRAGYPAGRTRRNSFSINSTSLPAT